VLCRRQSASVMNVPSRVEPSNRLALVGLGGLLARAKLNTSTSHGPIQNGFGGRVTADRDALRVVRLIVRNRPPDEGHNDSFVTVESAPRVTFAIRCVKGLRAGPIQRASVTAIDLRAARA